MITSKISTEAKKDLNLIRIELKKDKPDIDVLFNLISGSKYTIPIKATEPLKNLISQGNKKIGKDTIIFNMSSAKNCSSEKLGLCKCSAICYAKKSERLYPQVLPYRNRQAKYWKNCSAENFASEMKEIINSKKTKIRFIRFSESGDFLSQNCVDKLSKIADLLTGIVKVYTYTARKDLNFNNISDNLTVNGSGFMISNNFDITKDKSKVNCPADCSKCNKCKVTRNKVIYVLSH